jgi:uncharacterized cofD-like protein
LRRLLHIGLRIKRWLLIGILGIGVCAVGGAFVIKNFFDLIVPSILPWHIEGVIVVAFGVGLILLSLYGLFRSIGPLLFRYQSVNAMARTIYDRRSRERGPRIVAIGGGTGLSVLLRGLKAYTDNITAIVTVADDGGSSGRLRRELGLLPPGDFRNCLVALSDDEGLVAELFQYRFDQGNGLEGHSFGNLFIAAMTGVTGSFEEAIYESSRVLAVHGRILPTTMAPLSLSARLSDGTDVRGESNITERGGSIEQIFIEPPDREANPAAVAALNDAQLVVIGPGSLYTSILPNLLVSGITDALRASNAPKVYVCNVATEMGETDGYSVAEHVRRLQRHTYPRIADFLVANHGISEIASELDVHQVKLGADNPPNVKVVNADLIDASLPVRHDSVKLARVIMDVYHGKLPAEARADASVAG